MKVIYLLLNGQKDYYSLTKRLSECDALHQNTDTHHSSWRFGGYPNPGKNYARKAEYGT